MDATATDWKTGAQLFTVQFKLFAVNGVSAQIQIGRKFDVSPPEFVLPRP